MDFTTVFEVIAKYGWGSVAIIGCIALIYIGVRLIGNKIANNVKDGMENIADKLSANISQQNEVLSSNITKQNSELVKTISNQNERLLSFIMHKDAADEDIHDRKLEKRMEFAEDIIDKLRDIVNIANAQRAFIIEYHNSYKNLAGSPFAKYTCTYEWFVKGLDQVSTKISGLPYSTMAKIVGDIRRTGKHQKLYIDIDKMESENPQLFSLVKDPRTKGIFYQILYDENNKMMGMLVIEWQNNITKESFNERDLSKVLSEECVHLETWLNLQGPTIESEVLDE